SNRRPLLLFRGFFGFISLTLYFYAVSKIPLGNAAILNSTAPIFVIFLSHQVLKEKIGKSVYLSLPFFFLGVLLIVKPSHSKEWLFHTLVLISGLKAALAYFSVRKSGSTVHSVTVVCYFTLVSFFGSIPLLFFDWKPLNPTNVFYLTASGIFATLA